MLSYHQLKKIYKEKSKWVIAIATHCLTNNRAKILLSLHKWKLYCKTKKISLSFLFSIIPWKLDPIILTVCLTQLPKTTAWLETCKLQRLMNKL